MSPPASKRWSHLGCVRTEGSFQGCHHHMPIFSSRTAILSMVFILIVFAFVETTFGGRIAPRHKGVKTLGASSGLLRAASISPRAGEPLRPARNSQRRHRTPRLPNARRAPAARREAWAPGGGWGQAMGTATDPGPAADSVPALGQVPAAASALALAPETGGDARSTSRESPSG